MQILLQQNRTSQEEGLAPAFPQQRGQAPLPDLFYSQALEPYVLHLSSEQQSCINIGRSVWILWLTTLQM